MDKGGSTESSAPGCRGWATSSLAVNVRSRPSRGRVGQGRGRVSGPGRRSGGRARARTSGHRVENRFVGVEAEALDVRPYPRLPPGLVPAAPEVDGAGVSLLRGRGARCVRLLVLLLLSELLRLVLLRLVLPLLGVLGRRRLAVGVVVHCGCYQYGFELRPTLEARESPLPFNGMCSRHCEAATGP